MSRYYITALLLFIGGLILALGQAISSMMTAGEIAWKTLRVVDLLDTKHIEWIDGVSWEAIQSILQYASTAPVYALLTGTGLLLFLFGGIFEGAKLSKGTP